MAYLIGTDEAGYGPNLGPLLIAATVWEAPDGLPPADLYRALKKCVAAKAVADEGRLPIADSKALYSSGQGLAALELGVLTALALLERGAPSWKQIWPALLSADCHAQHVGAPWHAEFDSPLPVAIELKRVANCHKRMLKGLAEAGVRLVGMRAAAILPSDFNDLVDRYGSKGELLSLTTLQLAAQAIAELPDDGQPIVVTCDKHGGRGYYAAQLQHVFPDGFVQVCHESRMESIYRCGPANRCQFHFLAKGERMLPTALASMTAKYLRELAMIPFNQFWQQHVPGLKATAGYPGDASRFWEEIRPAQQRLGIADRVLWRCR